MKGMVGLALLLVGVGIAYVLIKRPTATPKAVTGPSTSNQVFGVLGTIGSKLVGAFAMSNNDKVAPPSGVTGTVVVPNEGTFTQGPSNVEGNTLTNDAGQTLTYGTD